MTNTGPDRWADRQLEIDRRQIEACAHYPRLWASMVADWSAADAEDGAWLTYSANYLFRTNNVQWAIDPLTLSWRLKGAPKVDAVRGLEKLSFVLLTHSHEDHLDLDLISALRHLPITWVVPEAMFSIVTGHGALSAKNIMRPRPHRAIELDGVRILPFDGLHWETAPDGTVSGVPSMGYLIETNGRRWLFPGDTRTYDASRLPTTEPIDILFAHLWLGRGCASMEEPPLLDAFCRFCVDLQPGQVVLTHLNEFGRAADDFWDESHVARVVERLSELAGTLPVKGLVMGESMVL